LLRLPVSGFLCHLPQPLLIAAPDKCSKKRQQQHQPKLILYPTHDHLHFATAIARSFCSPFRKRDSLTQHNVTITTATIRLAKTTCDINNLRRNGDEKTRDELTAWNTDGEPRDEWKFAVLRPIRSSNMLWRELGQNLDI
jgi:hypothetical protein